MARAFGLVYGYGAAAWWTTHFSNHRRREGLGLRAPSKHNTRRRVVGCVLAAPASSARRNHTLSVSYTHLTLPTILLV